MEGVVYGQDHVLTTPGPAYDLAFGSAGTGNGQFAEPGGVTVEAGGDVWVVDKGNNRLEKFGPDGEFLTKFGSKGSATANSSNRGTWRSALKETSGSPTPATDDSRSSLLPACSSDRWA